METLKKSIPIIMFVVGIAALGAALFLFGERGPSTTASNDTVEAKEVSISTFQKTDEEEIYTEDGKLVIFLFSTTWCPHCEWIKDTFDSTAKEYIDAGKIVAYHWELDTKDNTLTEEVESEVPEEHLEISQKFNPEGYVPVFIFGNKYVRIGNGYERTEDLASEKGEFIAVIEELLK